MIVSSAVRGYRLVKLAAAAAWDGVSIQLHTNNDNKSDNQRLGNIPRRFIEHSSTELSRITSFSLVGALYITIHLV